MEVSITAIHFEMSEELKEFITGRLDNLHERFGKITSAEVTLRVIRPDIPGNKQVMVSLMYPEAPDQVATKEADTFEEATDACIEALKKELEKTKDKDIVR